jgi:dihydroorotase
MKIQITDGRLLDPASRLDQTGSVCIENGRIAAVGQVPAGFKADQIIDARGKWVCPGLVDLSVRFGEPGQVQASIASETAAAARAGVTSLCCPPDGSPIIDTPAVVELIRQRAARADKARVYPIGALTHGLKGDRLAEMYALQQAGCIAVSNGNQPIASNEILRRAFEYAASTGLTVFIHAEDHSLRNQGVISEGEISTRLGLTPIPETAETVAVSTALLLIEQTGVRAHFCRLSTAKAVNMIAAARKLGLPITADVDICHLYLTEHDVDGYNTNCHLVPPLRRLQDKLALIQGLVDGMIDAVCSDHQPLSEDAKVAPFNLTRPGASTIEMLLPLMLDMVARKQLGLLQAIKKVTENPARILGLPAGTLHPGSAADLIIIDPDHAWTVKPAELNSAGKNTPFADWEMMGKVTHTFINGRPVYPEQV